MPGADVLRYPPEPKKFIRIDCRDGIANFAKNVLLHLLELVDIEHLVGAEL